LRRLSAHCTGFPHQHCGCVRHWHLSACASALRIVVNCVHGGYTYCHFKASSGASGKRRCKRGKANFHICSDFAWRFRAFWKHLTLCFQRQYRSASGGTPLRGCLQTDQPVGICCLCHLRIQATSMDRCQ